ncbi:hypothetical protein MPSEU_000091400 [Mayamaea pseudoterrestris]|nr:hypothetical protein MPSEU_000091400 [Mayamaea pseudoterrestris]
MEEADEESAKLSTAPQQNESDSLQEHKAEEKGEEEFKEPQEGFSNSHEEKEEEDEVTETDNAAAAQPLLDDDGRPLSEYERQRLERIERNKAYLQQLGLHEVKPPPKARPKKKEQPEMPLVKSRFSSRATKKNEISYAEPSLSVAALMRQEASDKPKKEKKLPKEPRPPREKKHEQRMVRAIYDEFQRINTKKKHVLKQLERDVRAAEKEIKFWTKRAEMLDRREQRKADSSTRESLIGQEREVLGGYSKRELLQQVDDRMNDIVSLAEKYDEEFEAEELAKERQIQRMETEAKNKTLDALDQFPKVLHDSQSLLTTILLQRLPKDPAPPRRSRRSSAAASGVLGESPAPSTKKRARQTKDDVASLNQSASKEWPDVQRLQDPCMIEESHQSQEDEGKNMASRSNVRIRTRSVRSVGGWISPNMAKLVDRTWLERDRPATFDDSLDFSMYAPQVGEAILYYPLGHKEHLATYPDALGKKLRSAQRVPLWERPFHATEQDSKAAAEGMVWWTEEWLQGMDDGSANYPILCRVERSYAEFPPDPFTKVVKKAGSNDNSQNVWKAPKDPGELKAANGAPLRLALILKPLTSVAPPTLDTGEGYASLPLPPIFSVVTFPSKVKPFIIPFSYAYAMWHLLDVKQDVILDGSKAQISDFAAIKTADTTRFNNKITEINEVKHRVDNAVSVTSFLDEALSGAGKSLSARDCRAVVEITQKYMAKVNQVDNSIMNSRPLDMILFIARTLPLWDGVCVMRAGKKRWISAWEVRFPEALEVLQDYTPDGLAAKGFDEALRRKIETVIEDFSWDNQEAGDLLYYTVTDESAPSYSCAVPVSMSLERILTRFGDDSDGDCCCSYRGVEHVLSDINLMLENCLLYNAPDSAIVESASVTVPQLREKVLRASQAYFQEVIEAKKADDERRRLVMSMSDNNVGLASSGSTSTTLGPMLATLRQPFADKVDPDWLQEYKMGGEANWVPQAGDNVLYSPTKHASFVQGHYCSLEAEQCVVPACFVGPVIRPDQQEWIQGRVVWVRASFPKMSSKRSGDDQITFKTSATLAAIGFQAKSGSTSVVYYRPCSLPFHVGAVGCPQCGLDYKSFIYACESPRSDDPSCSNVKSVSKSKRIENALQFLKKRCLKGESPSGIIPGLDKSSVKHGFKVPKVKLQINSLPSFHDLLFAERLDLCAPSSTKGTRGVKLRGAGTSNHNKSFVDSLSGSGFLPPWTAQSDGFNQCMGVSPNPKMSLELILLRIKNAFYRHTEAISNDIIESYVASVCVILSEPASRKKAPMQVKRIVRMSSKPNADAPAEEADDARAQEEFALASRIKRIRELHAMAFLAVSHTNTFECLFGLDEDVKLLSAPTVKVATHTAPKDPLREEARRKIALLLEAVGKDQLLNVFGQKFHGERASVPKSKLRITCGGLSVCHAKYFKRVSATTAELEDGRLLEVTIRANRKIISWLQEHEEEEDDTEDEHDEATDGLVNRLTDIRVSIKCGNKAQGKTTASLAGKLGDAALVRKVDDAIMFGNREYESSDSLVKFIFGRPGRKEPCARCQAHRRTYFTCRVRRSHSNPDYDWVANFEGANGIDELLVELDPTYARRGRQGAAGSDLGDAAPQASTAGKGEKVSASTERNDEELLGGRNDDAADDDDENKEDEGETSDPREQLGKAKLALRYGKVLLKQAQEYAAQPVRLSKEFIKSVYPVDKSDNHYEYCIICGLSGDLLCCDGCSNVVHSDCVALSNVPEDEWFCEECCNTKVASSTTEPVNTLNNLQQPDVESSSGLPTQSLGEEDTFGNGVGDVTLTNGAIMAASTIAEELKQLPHALVHGHYQRVEFDDSAEEKLSQVLSELNEARPERFRSKLRTDDPLPKNDEVVGQKRLISKRSSDDAAEEESLAPPPAKRRTRKASVEQASPAVRPVEAVVKLEASSFGRKRNRPQFLVENTIVGNFYASKSSENDLSSPRTGSRRSKIDATLWDDPFDRLNANAQTFLGSLDISTAEEFMKAKTGDIADAFISWRQKQKLPPLKGTGAIATISGWKTLCRDAAKEMGMEVLAKLEAGERSRSEDTRSRKRRRRTNTGEIADPIEALSDTAREFLLIVDINTAEALMAARSSDLATDLVQWRKSQKMPALKGTGAGATVSGWKALCRKLMDAPDATTSNPPQTQSSKHASKSSEVESESEGEEDADDGDKGSIEAGDPLTGLPEYAQTFLASRGITTAKDFLETKSSEISSDYVKWRKRHGMPVLKGSGPGAHIGAWKAIARKPPKAVPKKSIVGTDQDNGAANEDGSS